MGRGYLRLNVTTADSSLPLADAIVRIYGANGALLYIATTNEQGITQDFELAAPDVQYTLNPRFLRPAYGVCDVDVIETGFVTQHIHGVQIVDTQTSILPVEMVPLESAPGSVTDSEINIPTVALLIPVENRQAEAPPVVVDPPRTIQEVIIPDYITVHLGIPTNAAARNVRVKFADYIKNVVSSEIYSTWPYNALVANTNAIVTFALNRVYTEWYRSRGYNFDITNSTSYDMFYREGAQIFQNISEIVDGIFNVYARRIGFQNPFFTQFCNGSTVTCPGLSQWGTVTLANQGRSPLEILRHYYPRDLELVSSNNITGITESFPGYNLTIGSQGEPVRRMQNYLNRIRVNFPLIPVISNPNGVFGQDTANAVRTFQRTFNLTADGVIGRATWNKISFTFVGVAKLAELDSEGVRVSIGATPPTVTISQGSTGPYVLELQFLLNYIAEFYDSVLPVIKDSVFDFDTKNSVIAFQKTFNLAQDGIVGPSTWNKLYSVYKGIQANAPVPPQPPVPPTNAPPYPGTPLRVGSTGPDVRIMQTYLNTIRTVYTNIPQLAVDGSFGPMTERAVTAFQQQFLLTPDGVIGPETWNKIVQQFLLLTGNTSVSLQYPGTPLRLGSSGNDVRLMQGFLNELRIRYPSLPSVTVDGIFGPLTENAVMTFQRITGLVPDGIIGPITWYAIINQRNTIT